MKDYKKHNTEKLIKSLEKALFLARNGVIRAYALAVVEGDGSTSESIWVSSNDICSLVGTVAVLQQHLCVMANDPKTEDIPIDNEPA